MNNPLSPLISRVKRRLRPHNPELNVIGVFPLSTEESVVRFEAVIPQESTLKSARPSVFADGDDRTADAIELSRLSIEDAGREQLTLAYALRIADTTSRIDLSLCAPDAKSRLDASFSAQDLTRLRNQFSSTTESAWTDASYSRWLGAQNSIERYSRSLDDRSHAVSFTLIVVLPCNDWLDVARTVDSIKRQTHTKWELDLVTTVDSRSVPALASLQDDPRIRWRQADATGAPTLDSAIGDALQEARGAYIIVIEEGAFLDDRCLQRFAEHASDAPDVGIWYCDEDGYDPAGNEFSHPRFKPDFSRDRLYSQDYLGNLLAVSSRLLRSLEPPTGLDNPAWRYELALRALEAGSRFGHIPSVLHHRPLGESTPDADRAKSALEAHLARRGLSASITTSPESGVFITEYAVDDVPPKVSVIIPSKDHIDYLEPCIRSIERLAGYENYEIVVVENNSTELATFEYYEKLMKESSRVKVVLFEGPFNYSKVINFGVRHSQGDLLLLLNNDTAVITDGFLAKMAGYFTRPEIGVLGPQLLFPDGLVQHAGLSLMASRRLGFINQNLSPILDTGYLDSLVCASDYGAVLGACQMVRRATFDQVGGYREELAITCNDLDFCWKVRELGLSIVYTPLVQIYHKEFGSRGSDVANERRAAQSQREYELMVELWPSYYESGDHIVNPNCDGDSPYFKLGPIPDRGESL